MNRSRTTIFDIGANNGDDLPYYLRKADCVVAVEANPVLCHEMRLRFAEWIQAGRLIVENCVLTPVSTDSDVPFYIHKFNHVLSQFPPPVSGHADFEKTMLPAKTVESLFAAHGVPWYVKIDIENYDHVVLRGMFELGVFPALISAESHNPEVFALLASCGRYDQFMIVDGHNVHEKYQDWPISTRCGTEKYFFPYHSAGPFGEDLKAEWQTAQHCFKRLMSEGLGWRDIHASAAATRPSGTQGRGSVWKYWYYRIMLENKTRPYLGRCLNRMKRFLRWIGPVR